VTFSDGAYCSGNGNCTDYVNAYGCSCDAGWLGNRTIFYSAANGAQAPRFAWNDCNLQENPEVEESGTKNGLDISIIIGIVCGCLLLCFALLMAYYLKEHREHDRAAAKAAAARGSIEFDALPTHFPVLATTPGVAPGSTVLINAMANQNQMLQVPSTHFYPTGLNHNAPQSNDLL